MEPAPIAPPLEKLSGDKILVVGDDHNKIVETLQQEGIMEDVQREDDKKELGTKVEDVPLPEVGNTFMLKGHEYRVVYINEGQRRFSCVPMKGVY